MAPRVPFPPQVDPRLRDAWNRLQTLLGGAGTDDAYKLNYVTDLEPGTNAVIHGSGPQNGDPAAAFEGVANIGVYPTLVQRDVTLTDLIAAVDAAPDEANEVVVTVRVNGVDTAMTVTILGAATRATFTGSVSLSAGDLISIHVTNDVGSASSSVVAEVRGTYA